jgi:hypothetical protein
MSAIQFAYLGKAGAMQQLVQPPKGFQGDPSLGDSAHTLLSGGTAMVRNLNAKKLFTLPYDVTADQSDVILGFYRGLYGTGPYRFVDPTARNMLGLDVSTLGLRGAAALGWYQSTGNVARSSSGGPSSLQTGVLTWSSLSASATIQPGVATNTADVNSAPVYISAEPVTVSVYVMASSSSSGHTLQLVGYDSAGAVLVSSANVSMSLTTSWQRFSVTIAAGAGGYGSAIYVLPRIVLGAAVPTSVSVAAAQLEYADTVSTWQPGFGCPKVVISQGPGRTISAPGWRSHTLTLAEV